MKTFASIALLCIVTATALGQDDYGFSFSKAGSAGFQSLKIGIGAREVAMGEAATSTTNRATSVFWNAGGLAFVEQNQVYFSHNNWINGSRHDAVVVAAPVGDYVVALSAVQFAIAEFEETTVQFPQGTGRMVDAGDLVFGLAVARRFTDRLTIGLQLKYLNEKLDNDSFGNVLFDVGTIYFTGFHHMRLAFALQHFGPDKKILRQSFRTPLLFRLSAGDDLVLTEVHRLTTAVDLVHPTDNAEWVNFGGEYEFMKMFALRAGYRVGVDEGNLTLGAGVAPPLVGGIGVSLDYAYAKFGAILGTTHRITVGVTF
jgi:hypothetical protein